MTTIVFLAIAVLLAAALVKRPEAITIALALSFVAAVLLSTVRHGEELRPLLMALDSFVAIAMLGLWAKHHSQRARLVGTISLAKCTVAAIYMSVSYTVWQTYAAAINAAFVVQVLVAGGFADGLVDRLWWAFARRSGLRRNVGN